MWKNNKKISCSFGFSRSKKYYLASVVTQAYSKGITLIELLIAVAIIGILASLSVPSYFNYVRQGEISDSLSTLSVLASRMESEYLNNRNYGIPPACSIGDIIGLDGVNYTCESDNNGQGYEWTARSAGYWYSLDNFGNRTTRGFPGITNLPVFNCWAKSDVPGDCF